VLSSKNESKVEERFAARLDVLMERVDTLAATVATTASAIAKKDGEIASLRRDLEARDAAIQALSVQTQSDSGVSPRELQRLQQAVADLSSGSDKKGSSKQVEELGAKLALLGQRLDTLSATVSTTAAGLAGREGEIAALRKQFESAPAGAAPGVNVDDALRRQLETLTSNAVGAQTQIDGLAAELAGVRERLERRDTDLQAPSEELKTMLTTLHSRIESLAGLRSGVTEEQLEARLADVRPGVTEEQLEARLADVRPGVTEEQLEARIADVRGGMTEEQLEARLAEDDRTVAKLSERVDALAASVESALERLSDKEHELAALHRHFTESSSRIETIVGDIRDALGAFPEMGPDALDTLGSQLESTSTELSAVVARVERLEAVRADQDTSALADRIDVVDTHVAAVAAEMARAKTLWPVALRSLEARLDDVAAASRRTDAPETADETEAPPPAEVGDDLLAGLRDSIQAMESVAEEMARASDAWATDDKPEPELEPEPAAEAVGGGARIVPLRANDP
jgi:chromosome segregation ATPase